MFAMVLLMFTIKLTIDVHYSSTGVYNQVTIDVCYGSTGVHNQVYY